MWVRNKLLRYKLFLLKNRHLSTVTANDLFLSISYLINSLVYLYLFYQINPNLGFKFIFAQSILLRQTSFIQMSTKLTFLLFQNRAAYNKHGQMSDARNSLISLSQ